MNHIATFIRKGSPIGLVNLIHDLKGNNLTMAEIGVYAGESTSIFAASKRFKTIHAVDPWKNGYDDSDPASITFDMNLVEKEFDSVVQRYDPIIVKHNISREALQLPADLDLVYIDANHQYAAVINDFKTYLPLIKRGGAISGHDYWYGFKDTVCRAVNETFGRPDKVYDDGSWIKYIPNVIQKSEI
jgi:hypothetical protein